MTTTPSNGIIIDRGRGPEIAGTRVTVYRIMDFVRDRSAVDEIAEELELTDEQVRAAMDYITANRIEVESEYARIVERARQGNPAWVDAGRATSPEELRERLRQRIAADSTAASRT